MIDLWSWSIVNNYIMRSRFIYERAANNSWSSDIGWPKFACVRQNPTVVGHVVWTIFYRNSFMVRVNQNLQWVNLIFFGDTQPQFVLSDQDGLSRTCVLLREKKFICSPVWGTCICNSWWGWSPNQLSTQRSQEQIIQLLF